MKTATAFWIAAPGSGELRKEVLPPTALGEARIETLYSGISRGTERLVFRGEVPAEERTRMRCPLQQGDLPGPVKYGYAAVGRIESGPVRIEGRTVFCLHPHQDRFSAPAGMAVLLPPGVPAARAVLGANMETAVNILWDAGCLPGDRIAVVGAGVVGLLVASLAVRIPGTEVTLVDVDPGKRALARHFGCGFALPDEAPEGCDVVVHASGSPEGLGTALAAAGFEATVVEASWYGNRTVAVGLGGAFHSRR
ncbi:MAG: zinc-binding alcohol dehydrogenase, partial [Rhizobiaceae bacterium]|nr:zinc-binding alcohol dehydrogenase [Rhizobiaceae bacterium]